MQLKKSGGPPTILTLSSNIHKKKINRFRSLSSKKTRDMNNLIKFMSKYYKDMIYSPNHLDYNNINYLSKKGLTTSNLLIKSIKDSTQIIDNYEKEDFLEQDLYTPDYLKENNNEKIKKRNKSSILNIKKNSINKEINSYFDFDLRKDVNEKNKNAINKLFKYNEKVKKLKKLNQLKSEIIRNSQNKKYTTFKTFEKPIDRKGLSFYRDTDSKNFYSDVKSKYMDLYLKNPNKRNNDNILNSFSLSLKTENPTKIFDTNSDIKRENSNNKISHKNNKSIDIFQNGLINSTLNSTSNNSIITIYKKNKKKITLRKPLSKTQKSSMKNIFNINKNKSKKIGKSVISHINDIQFEAKKESFLLKESYNQDNKYNKQNNFKRKSKSNEYQRFDKEKNLVNIEQLNKEFKFDKNKNEDENCINEYEIIRKNAENVFTHLDKNGRKILIEVLKKMEYDDKRLHKKYIVDCLNDRRLFKKRMEKEFLLVAKESIALDKKLSKKEENINENEKELMIILRNILQKKYTNEDDLKEVIYRCNALKRIYLYEYRRDKENGKFNQEIRLLQSKEGRNEDYYKRKSKSYNFNRTKSLY